jgi:hypothetical protein
MWTNFFLASAAASATLAGLVIVAVSVNITRILAHPQLPARAGATVSTLILILLSSMATLIPQSLRFLGAEIVLFGVCCWMIEVFSALKSIEARRVSRRPIHESFIHVLFGQLQTLPFIVGGAYVLRGNPNGFYFIAFGIMVTFFASTSNAWVLLVEILR